MEVAKLLGELPVDHGQFQNLIFEAQLVDVAALEVGLGLQRRQVPGFGLVNFFLAIVRFRVAAHSLKSHFELLGGLAELGLPVRLYQFDRGVLNGAHEVLTESTAFEGLGYDFDSPWVDGAAGHFVGEDWPGRMVHFGVTVHRPDIGVLSRFQAVGCVAPSSIRLDLALGGLLHRVLPVLQDVLVVGANPVHLE